MKVYKTREDTCIFETPVMWGSKMVFDLQVYLKLGPIRVVIPVHVSDVQFKVLSRVILHLVDTFPCMGGATVSLLEVPHFDFKLQLFGCPVDLMSLPGVKWAVRYATQFVVKEVALYPNSISVPLMSNFGVPENPKGMLHVRLLRMKSFKSADTFGKSDPYVVFEVREGRPQKSKVVRGNNNPEFHEDFFLVVDNLETQTLTIKVYDQDLLMPEDELLGIRELYFSEEKIVVDEVTGEEKVVFVPAPYIVRPMEEEVMNIQYYPGAGGGLLGNALGSSKKLISKLNKSLKMKSKSTVEKQLPEGLNARFIKVAKTRKQIREEKEKAMLKKQAEEEAAKVAAQQLQQKGAEKEQKQHKALAKVEAQEAEAAYEKESDSESEYEWVDEEAERLQLEKEKQEEEAAKAEKARLKAMTKKQRKEEAQRKKEEEERKKAEDEEPVLVDQMVALRGNGPDFSGQQPMGCLEVVLSFMPFEQPKHDDDIETKPVKEGLQAFIPFEPPAPREILTNVSEFQKGLLTITLLSAKALGKQGANGSVDPYVEFILVDCDGARNDERHLSRTVNNDSSPRWADKFDFVMVSAGSMLTVNVWDHTSPLEMLTSLKLSKERFKDQLLGKVQIPVMDVVRNGMLKDHWPLQQAESGTIEMKLEWSNCYVDDYDL